MVERGSRRRGAVGRPGALSRLGVGAALCAGAAMSLWAGAPASAATKAANDSSIVIGSSVAPPSLDPTSNAAAAIDEVFDYNVYQHLAQLSPNGKIVPVLASSWTVSKTGTVYTFTLRRGVTFSNGDPLTPSDVVYSIDRVTAPGSQYPYKNLWTGLVKSAAASGSDKVVVTLAHRDWEWLYTLAAYSNGEVLDPSAVASIATHPVGTGPFAFTGYVPNYSVTLVRNPHYWGPAPKVAKVEFRYFSTPNAEISALRGGQIDIIDNLPVPQSVRSLKSAGFTVDIGPTSGKVQLTLNDAYGPLRKQLVRQAISYALTKKAMDQAAEAGYGRIIGSDSVPGDPYFLPKLANLYPHSIKKAKALLAKAGYPHGFPLKLVLPPYPYAKADGPVVAAELKQVGIDVTLSNIQWPLWLSQVFEAGDFQSTIIDHAEARDISNYTNPKYYWHYADTREVTTLLTEGNEAPTRAQWAVDYEKAETLIAHQAVNVWFFNLPEITVAKRGIVGLPHGSLSESFQLSALQIGGKLTAAERRLGFTS